MIEVYRTHDANNAKDAFKDLLEKVNDLVKNGYMIISHSYVPSSENNWSHYTILAKKED